MQKVWPNAMSFFLMRTFQKKVVELCRYASLWDFLFLAIMLNDLQRQLFWQNSPLAPYLVSICFLYSSDQGKYKSEELT